MKWVMAVWLWLLMCSMAKAQELTVVTENWPPLQIVEKGKVTGGFATQLTRALLDAAGDKTTPIRGFAWARAYKMALEQPNVLIFSIVKSEQRLNKFKWIGQIMPLDNHLWHLTTRKDIRVKSLEEAKNYRFAIPRNDIRHQYLRNQGFKDGINLDVVNSNYNSLSMLLRGRSDLIIANRAFMQYELKMRGLAADILYEIPGVTINFGGLYIAFSKQTSDATVERYRQAFARLQQNGTHKRIVDQYLATEETAR